MRSKIKTVVFLVTIFIGMIFLGTDNQSTILAQTSQTKSTTSKLTKDKKSPYYKYKYAYQYKNTKALSKTELKFYKKLKKCLDSASKYKTLYKKEKAVYDWIVLNCAYDYNNYCNNTIPTTSFHPEGVFLKGAAVCNGYMESFQLCMDILGIQCKMVTGKDALTNQSHAWNAVKLDDGKWYQVDVTWGDPVPDKKGSVDYKYFNLTDAQMKQTHSYTCAVSCKGTKYSYWNAFEKDVKHITSQNQFYTIAANAIKNKQTSVKIAISYNLRYAPFYDYYYTYTKSNQLADYSIEMKDTKNGCVYANLIINYDNIAGIISDASQYQEAIEYACSKKWSYFKVYVSDSKFVPGNYGSDVIQSCSATIDSVMYSYDRVHNSDLYELGITLRYMEDGTLADEEAVVQKIGECLAKHTVNTEETFTLYMQKPSGLQGLNVGAIKARIVNGVESTYGISSFQVFVSLYGGEMLEIVFRVWE